MDTADLLIHLTVLFLYVKERRGRLQICVTVKGLFYTFIALLAYAEATRVYKVVSHCIKR
jgi:hypothetical protein